MLLPTTRHILAPEIEPQLEPDAVNSLELGNQMVFPFALPDPGIISTLATVPVPAGAKLELID